MERLLFMRGFDRALDKGGWAAAVRELIWPAAAFTQWLAGRKARRSAPPPAERAALPEVSEAYLAHLRTILRETDEADRRASVPMSELAGTLRVHATPMLASQVIAPQLAGFQMCYPDIAVDLVAEACSEPPVHAHDLVLFGADARPAPQAMVRKVIDADVVLVAAPRYLQEHSPPLVPADLARRACLRLHQSGADPCLWRMWRATHPDQALEVAIMPKLVANHSETLLGAALDGAGITAASLDVAAPYLVRGELVRVLAPWVTGRAGLYAAVPSDKRIAPRTRVFLNWLVEETRYQMAEAAMACRVQPGSTMPGELGAS